MIRIYKYPLEVVDWQVINLPGDAEILTVKIQADIPCLWALVETGKPDKAHEIQIYRTGDRADGAGVYIATFQTGPYVFHVFEAGRRLKAQRTQLKNRRLQHVNEMA